MPALACGAGGIGIPGIPGMSGIGALVFIFIEQQLAHDEQHPPAATAEFAQHTRPQQLRTDVAMNFNIEESPQVRENTSSNCPPPERLDQ